MNVVRRPVCVCGRRYPARGLRIKAFSRASHFVGGGVLLRGIWVRCVCGSFETVWCGGLAGLAAGISCGWMNVYIWVVFLYKIRGAALPMGLAGRPKFVSGPGDCESKLSPGLAADRCRIYLTLIAELGF